MLAAGLDADAMLILTDIDRVSIHDRTPQEQWLDEIAVTEAEKFLHEGHFAEGSMTPKV